MVGLEDAFGVPAVGLRGAAVVGQDELAELRESVQALAEHVDALDADVLAAVAAVHERADTWVTTEARTTAIPRVALVRRPDSHNGHRPR